MWHNFAVLLWAERFLLGGVFVAVFVAVVVMNTMRLDLTQRITLGIAIVSLSIFLGHTIEKGRERGPAPTVGFSAPTGQSANQPTQQSSHPPESTTPIPASPHVSPPKPTSRGSSSSPLTGFTDSQRFVLKKKFSTYPGNTVRLVLIGNDPQLGIVFEQLIDIFQDSGWKVEEERIGMVAAVGVNFPSVPYLTGPDMAAPILQNAFSVFSNTGIDLPLVPDAFIGSSRETSPPVVIVIHGH